MATALLDSDPIALTPEGLYCKPGGFHIDPWRPVERAVVTHAHADHACFGCGHYLTTRAGQTMLRERVGAEASISVQEYGVAANIGGARVSLHPAGHILGSAQVRVECPGCGVWVVSGDYKTVRPGATPDATCEPFEPVRCDVFISESTFGLPIYRWRDQAELFAEINAWWRLNQSRGRTSIVYAWALGKAQRVLAGVDASIGPLAAHGAVDRMNRAYAAAGVAMPPVAYASAELAPDLRGRGLIVAPPSAAGTPWLRKFAGPDGLSAAFASGWMQVRGARRWRAVDRGFVLSDHADWDGLLWAIRETGATRVGVTHGFTGPVIRFLRESMGLDAFEIQTRFEGERIEQGPEGGPGEGAEAGEGAAPARGDAGGAGPGEAA